MIRKWLLIYLCISGCLVHGLRLKRTLANFGTVLFRNVDVNRNSWPKRQIGLLNARQILQQLIPPDEILDTVDENYIVALLKYFTKAYEAIRIVASDYETDVIMTEALSDVIGGYLKGRILPATRYGYYAGTIPYDDAMKMIHLYEVIKDYLKTDGSAWHPPNDNKLSQLKINVAPIPNTTRPYGCDQLTLFEKCDEGLTVPVPTVNWSPRSSVMFLPIKNNSLIEIDSPSSRHCVLNYYNTATECLRNDRQSLEKFKTNFQNWLTKRVVPHLGDDRLYVAFDGVLGLATDCLNIPECDDRTSSGATNRDTGSLGDKLHMFMMILAIEIMGCIPILLCIKLCKGRGKKKKKRNKKDGSADFHLQHKSGEKGSTDTKNLFQSSNKSDGKQKEKQQWENMETLIDVTYIKGCTACRSSNQHTKNALDNETEHKTSQCKLLEKHCSASSDDSDVFENDQFKGNETKSVRKVSEKMEEKIPEETQETSTTPRESKNSSQSDRTSSTGDRLEDKYRTGDYLCLCNDADYELTSSKDQRSSNSSRRKATTITITSESCSLKSDDLLSGETPASSSSDKDSSVHQVERDTQTLEGVNQKKIKQIRLECSTNENGDEDSCRERLYRIKVRQAHRHIGKSSNTRSQSEAANEVKQSQNEMAPQKKTDVVYETPSNKGLHKPSRIPKRTLDVTATGATATHKDVQQKGRPLESCAPAPRRPADDSAAHAALTKNINDTHKLNETL